MSPLIQPIASALPGLKTLTVGLSTLLRGDAADGNVTVLQREPFVNSSTFASEVVTCLLGDGRRLQLLCKYASKNWSAPGEESWGYRRGVVHEAAVYQHILRFVPLSAPKFFGAYTDPASGGTWLVLEYIEGAERVNKSAEPGAMGLAARWMGRFHAIAAAQLQAGSFPFLKTYDEEDYGGWMRRTLEFAGAWHQRFPWLQRLGGRFDGWASLLLGQKTITHGEYYPKNILYRDGRIYPVDWESAAIAAGEIDLAALTETWPAETVEECKREYQRARWPAGAPPDFLRRLDAALVFNMFRWLGDEPEMTRARSMRFYFYELRAAAQRLGLI